jgi:tRNA (guanine-N(7)-)-methyltransferase subunit TRM82
LQYLSQQQDGRWQEDVNMAKTMESSAHAELKVQLDLSTVDEKAVRDMLYNVENLRKRPGAED